MHPGYPELVKTALASDVYWHVPEHGTTVSSIGGLFGDPIVLENHTQYTRNEETAGQMSSILDATGEKLAVEPIPQGEKIPDMRLRQVVMVVEDSREIINKFSPSHLAYRASKKLAKERARKRLQEITGLNVAIVREPSFEEELTNFYDRGVPQYEAETVVNYNRTDLAIVRRSLMFLKRDRDGRLLGAPGVVQTLPRELWKLFQLTEMPDIEVGGTYSKGRRGSINYLGKIAEAYMVEPRHVVWKDQQRPKSKRHKRRRVPQLSDMAPGKLAANRA